MNSKTLDEWKEELDIQTKRFEEMKTNYFRLTNSLEPVLNKCLNRDASQEEVKKVHDTISLLEDLSAKLDQVLWNLTKSGFISKETMEEHRQTPVFLDWKEKTLAKLQNI